MEEMWWGQQIRLSVLPDRHLVAGYSTCQQLDPSRSLFLSSCYNTTVLQILDLRICFACCLQTELGLPRFFVHPERCMG